MRKERVEDSGDDRREKNKHKEKSARARPLVVPSRTETIGPNRRRKSSFRTRENWIELNEFLLSIDHGRGEREEENSASGRECYVAWTSDHYRLSTTLAAKWVHWVDGRPFFSWLPNDDWACSLSQCLTTICIKSINLPDRLPLSWNLLIRVKICNRAVTGVCLSL